MVKSLNGFMEGCIFRNAFVSVLEPGTVIEKHCGPSNVRHRLHFALQIPKKNGDGKDCLDTIPSLIVAGEKITWAEGKAFVFDDSLVHSACNPPIGNTGDQKLEEDSGIYSEARVVLIVDLWHPELEDTERVAITQLYPSLP